MPANRLIFTPPDGRFVIIQRILGRISASEDLNFHFILPPMKLYCPISERRINPMDICQTCPAYKDINEAIDEFREEKGRNASKSELEAWMFSRTKCPGGEATFRAGKCPRKIDAEQMTLMASQARIKTPILNFSSSLRISRSGVGKFSKNWNVRALNKEGRDVLLTDYLIGNVHTGGNICWGRLKGKTPADGRDAVSMFFMSPFNGDLGGGYPSVKRHMESYEISVGGVRDDLLTNAIGMPEMAVERMSFSRDYYSLECEVLKIGPCTALAALTSDQFLELAPPNLVFDLGSIGKVAFAKAIRSTDRKTLMLDFNDGKVHVTKGLTAKSQVATFEMPKQ